MYMTNEEKYLEVIRELAKSLCLKNFTIEQLEQENAELKKKVEEFQHETV